VSSLWSWFVVLVTVGTLLALLALLFGNRKAPGGQTTGHAHDGIEELDNPLPMWWVWLFVLTIVFGAGYLAWYPGLGNFRGLASWTSTGAWQDQVERHDARFAPVYAELASLDEPALHASREAQQVGRRLFLNNCASCHGVTAQGAFGFPNLTDAEWIWGEGIAAVKTAIQTGRQAAMPPWGAALGDPGVTNVVNYVLALGGRDHDQAAAATGTTQFQAICTACHGPEGKGNPALGAPDLTNDIWLYGSAPDEIAHTVRFGRNGSMPAHADILTDAQIQILAAYVTSLSKSPLGVDSVGTGGPGPVDSGQSASGSFPGQ
jgi:cytochrome c oxidase cbb3-type subunit 3